MESEQWTSILLEWVNCLKLSQVVSCLDDLRTGDFFLNLQKVITKSNDECTDTATFIFNLLSNHYPNYTFKKKDAHLLDLPKTDIISITSLLMHYTCIYDRKDVLTSPLCDSLKQSTQLKIRNFLQNMTTDLNYDTLNTIISSCLEKDTSSNEWFCANTTNNSPLQYLLKTPVSKTGRLQEKDRLIAKLKAELDGERYDKLELQEELKGKTEENFKLNKIIVEKNNKILRLRTEIGHLEGQIQPNGPNQEAKDLERLLKKEIEGLEEYIKRVEEEQEGTIKEKEVLSSKLKKTEAESIVWQQKFFETERNIESLKLLTEKQRGELKQLKEHCAEVTALLDEYRSKPANDSSLFEYSAVGKPSVAILEEDLAGSVVEVQLRDAQALIEELKAEMERRNGELEKLKKNEEEALELKKTVSSLSVASSDLARRLEEAVADVEMEKMKARLLETELCEAKSVSQKLQFELAESVLSNEEKSSVISELEKYQQVLVNQLSDSASYARLLEGRLSDSELYLETQRNEIDDLQNMNLSQSEQLFANQQRISELDEEKRGLVLDLQKSAEKIKNLQSDLDNISERFTVCSANLETSDYQLKQVKEQLNDALSLVEQLKSDSAANESEAKLLKTEKFRLLSQIKEIEECNSELKNKNEGLVLAKTRIEAEFTKISNDFQQLSLDYVNMERQLDDAYESLEALKKQKLSCEEENHALEAQVEELVNVKQELSNELELTKIREAFLEANLEEDRALVKELQMKNDDIFAELEETKKVICELEEDKQQLALKIEEMEKTVGDINSELKNKAQDVDSKNLKINELIVAMENLEANILEKEGVSKALKIDLDNVQNQLDEERAISIVVKQELEELKNTKGLLNERVEVLECENTELKRSFEEKGIDLQETQRQLEGKIKEIEELKVVVQGLEVKLEEGEKSLKSQQINFDCLQNEKLTLSDKIEELCCEKQEIEANLEAKCEDFNKLEEEKNVLATNVNQLQLKIQDLSAREEALRSELSEERKMKQEQNEGFTRKIEQTKAEKEELNKHLLNERSGNDLLLTNLRNIEEKCINLEKEKEEFLTKNCKLSEGEEYLKSENSRLTKELALVKEETQEVSKKNQVVEMLLEQMKHEKREIDNKVMEQKSVIENICKDKEECEMEIRSLKKKNVELSRQNEEFWEKANKGKMRCEALKEELNEARQELQVLNKSKEEIEELFHCQTSKLIELQETIQINEVLTKDLEEKLLVLQSKNDDLTSQNEHLLKTVEENEAQCSTLKQQMEDTIATNEEIKIQKNQIEENLRCLNEKHFELQENLQNKLSMIEDFEKTTTHLQNKNEELTSQNECVKEEMDEIVSKYEHLKKQKEEAEEQLTELSKVSGNSDVLVQELSTEIIELNRKKEELSAQNEEFLRTIAMLERDYKELKNHTYTVEKQLNEVSNLSEALKTEAQDISQKYEQTKTEMEEKEKVATKLNQCLQTVSEEKEAIKKQLDEKESLLLLIKEKKDVVEAEISQKYEQIKAEFEAKERDLTKVNQCLQAVNEEKESMKKQLDEKESQLSLIKQEKDVFEIGINTKYAQTKAELEDKKQDVTRLNQSLQTLKEEKEALKKQLEEKDSELALVKEKKDVSEAEISQKVQQIKAELEEKERDLAKLNQCLQTSSEEKEAMQKELDEKESQLSLVRQKNDDLESEINRLKVMTDSYKSDLENVMKQSGKSEVVLEDNEREIAELNEKIDRLNVEKFDLEKKIEVEEIISSERRERVRTLEETLQDYELTISGLKTVVDENLEQIEMLKAQISEKEKNEAEIVKTLDDLLEQNNVAASEKDLKTAITQIITKKCEEASELQTKIRLLEESNKEKLQQIDAFSREKEAILKPKNIKTEKENVLNVSTKPVKSREEELKKENMMLKRKLVITENAKSNLEKTLKENKAAASSTNEDYLYKKLLQDYIQVKEENERIVKEKDEKIAELMKSHNEGDKKLVQDLQNIREAYSNVISVNSKLELEVVTLRKIIEERNMDVANMAHIKEAYEKLLEDNNKLMTEVDTVKYKRNRDKEEFVRLLKKEREEGANRESKRTQDIRSEYELKLEKMKDKMLKLYREEVNKKVKSVKDGHNETAQLMRTVADLRSELFEADQRIQLLEMEKEFLKANRPLEMQKVASMTSLSRERAATLPRASITKEITISQTTSVGGMNSIGLHNVHMEDEEDLFNDKYLADMKAGRCPVDPNRESNVSRFSELAWRNSMVPPHLKSSYPAETQFVSPGRFKDDEIKAGNIEFEDSLCKLLPGDKPRKKDFGTTSYKKPGPPTPSKNGGRLSLQGNEVHPLREHCETKTPKRATPSRIRALFAGRNSSTSVESQNTPNRGRRLNIFRKPK